MRRVDSPVCHSALENVPSVTWLPQKWPVSWLAWSTSGPAIADATAYKASLFRRPNFEAKRFAMMLRFYARWRG